MMTASNERRCERDPRRRMTVPGSIVVLAVVAAVLSPFVLGFTLLHYWYATGGV